MESAKLLHLSGVQQNITLTSSTGHYAQPQPAKPFHGQKTIISISKSVPTGFKNGINLHFRNNTTKFDVI